MKILIWVMIVCGIFLFIGLLIGTFITLGIIKPKRRSLLETSMLEEEKFPGIMDFYKHNLTERYRLKSRYGYDLAIYFMKNLTDTNKYLVMSHGHTYTHHGCLKYAGMMMAHGYNIVLYDQRYHGDSGGPYTSLGYYEKDDLYDIITDTIDRFGKDIEVGTYGESMGAATVLLEAEIDDRVKYVFADCGFTNLDVLVGEIIQRNLRFPLNKLQFLSRFVFQMIVETKMSRISPKDALIRLHVPVFFAHGLNDTFISSKHTVEMADSYAGDKQVFLAGNNAGHAGSYLADTNGYETAINEFIKKYVSKKS